MIAPADGPKSNAAAMLKVSEMEKLIGIAGMRSVAQPLATVSASRMSHSAGIGRDNTSETEYARRIAPARLAPQTNTALCEICTNPVIGRSGFSNHRPAQSPRPRAIAAKAFFVLRVPMPSRRVAGIAKDSQVLSRSSLVLSRPEVMPRSFSRDWLSFL